MQAVHIEIGGQRFHLRLHLMLPFVAHALHRVFGILQGGIGKQHLERRLAQSSKRRTERGHELGAFSLQRRNPCFIRLHRFIIRVVRRQAAEISGEMAKAIAQRFQRVDHVGGFQGVTAERRSLRFERFDVADEHGFEFSVVRVPEAGEPGFEGPAVGGGSGGRVGHKNLTADAASAVALHEGFDFGAGAVVVVALNGVSKAAGGRGKSDGCLRIGFSEE